MPSIRDREQLRLTSQLITSEPTTLTLWRAPKGRTAAGGSAPAGPAVVQDPIKVFFGAKTQDDMPMQDSQGERVVAYYTIVALPGTDIQEGDYFTVAGDDYKVTRVSRHLSYELKADAQTYYGGYR